MIRSPGATGFERPLRACRFVPTDHAVAASLAIGALSLCLIVTLTLLSIRVSMAMPTYRHRSELFFRSHCAAFCAQRAMIRIATGHR